MGVSPRLLTYQSTFEIVITYFSPESVNTLQFREKKIVKPLQSILKENLNLILLQLRS